MVPAHVRLRAILEPHASLASITHLSPLDICVAYRHGHHKRLFSRPASILPSAAKPAPAAPHPRGAAGTCPGGAIAGCKAIADWTANAGGLRCGRREQRAQVFVLQFVSTDQGGNVVLGDGVVHRKAAGPVALDGVIRMLFGQKLKIDQCEGLSSALSRASSSSLSPKPKRWARCCWTGRARRAGRGATKELKPVKQHVLLVLCRAREPTAWIALTLVRYMCKKASKRLYARAG
eukprot:TRINITY_DN12154_c0_g1_i2.p1 TRINITY_DN12154_c0_g1~~TRINITY_DN12154_c0_g1_i2.p1  ORF type:complete len:234 (+),score=8.23 TRINITY_DN12154_c0_g1_i2:778-1479(+)